MSTVPAAAADAGETTLDRLDAIVAMPDAEAVQSAASIAGELLAIGETIVESWVKAQGREPTDDAVEGFRILALHRQGARGEPSFNACRETCRELVYLYNCISLDPDGPDTARHVHLAAMVARHLVLFIDGKLEDSGLGDFCCSSRPLRQRDALTGAPVQS